MSIRSVRTVASGATALCAVLLMTGCAQPAKPLYHWEGYQRQVYEYLKADGSTPTEQLTLLQAQAEKARAINAVLPPGFRAHLGMLYLKTGRFDEARQAFESEKTAFPESTQYMNFLLKGLTEKKS